MLNLILSYVASFLALALIAYSYLINKKGTYLVFQGLGIVFLIISYFFISKYFAMISMIVALFRTIVFGIYELKNKNAPLILSYIIAGLTILCFYIVNVVVLKTFSWLDIMHVIALCFYSFTFRMRNLTKMRLTLIMPAILEVLYNIIMLAPIFTIISYSIELCSVLIAIVRFDILKTENLKAPK